MVRWDRQQICGRLMALLDSPMFSQAHFRCQLVHGVGRAEIPYADSITGPGPDIIW